MTTVNRIETFQGMICGKNGQFGLPGAVFIVSPVVISVIWRWGPHKAECLVNKGLCHLNSTDCRCQHMIIVTNKSLVKILTEFKLVLR